MTATQPAVSLPSDMTYAIQNVLTEACGYAANSLEFVWGTSDHVFEVNNMIVLATREEIDEFYCRSSMDASSDKYDIARTKSYGESETGWTRGNVWTNTRYPAVPIFKDTVAPCTQAAPSLAVSAYYLMCRLVYCFPVHFLRFTAGLPVIGSSSRSRSIS
ncbi:hypothetical protein J6590_075036 [Homalodisca vitripennis]|nr:hypothetical protein J6590_075036 [Homalodisca vitripennis]